MLPPLPPRTTIVPTQEHVNISRYLAEVRPLCKVFHITGQQFDALLHPAPEDWDALRINPDDASSLDLRKVAVPFPVVALKMDPVAYYGPPQTTSEIDPETGKFIMRAQFSSEGSGSHWILIDSRKEEWTICELVEEMAGTKSFFLNYAHITPKNMSIRAIPEAIEVKEIGRQALDARIQKIFKQRYVGREDANGITINLMLGTRLNFTRFINFCLLLSAKGVTSTIIPDPSAPFNRQQKKAISWVPVEHYIVRMANPKRDIRSYVSAAQTYIAQLREQEVRGHMRQYKDGRQVKVNPYKRYEGKGPPAKDRDYDARGRVKYALALEPKS